MRVDGVWRRGLWEEGDAAVIIDQVALPHRFETVRLRSADDAARAIASMQVRGAPLIGVTAAYGLALGLRQAADDVSLASWAQQLKATRPTAVNLAWAVDALAAQLRPVAPSGRADAAWQAAGALAEAEVDCCRRIGEHGLRLVQELAAGAGRINVLTHCNAGWLATVDHGTALAPIYAAVDAGLDVHVWVDETRPRSQGYLTAWELAQHGVAHTVVSDNSGGHLMQHGLVDLCIVGTDRTTRTGDVCNKIGTYLKALAAEDNGVPFYVAAPSSSIDFAVRDGLREIEIEQRHGDELAAVTGVDADGALRRVRVVPAGSPVRNDAFDVTPARLVTALITERGPCAATEAGLRGLFPERS